MYEEFKQSSNYQALQDTQINKIIAAQQRRYNPSLLGDVYQEKPNNLYQQYLNETGLINNDSNQYSVRQKGEQFQPPPQKSDPHLYDKAFDPVDVKEQPLPSMPSQDYYAGKPNPEPPQSVYSRHVNEPPSDSFGKPNHNFTEKMDYQLRSNNDDYSYVDTYEMDKKLKHQNYSNLLGRKLGDPNSRPKEEAPQVETDILGMPQRHGTLEAQRMQQGARFKKNRDQNLYPSIHYTEYRDNRLQRREPDPRVENPQDVKSRTDRMVQALRKGGDDQDDYRNQGPRGYQDYPQPSGYGSKHEKYDKAMYEESLYRKVNPINHRYNSLRDESVYSEHSGNINVVNYRIMGDREYLRKMTCVKLKAEFLKNSFHVMNFRFESDPLSGNLTGIVTFKARVLVHKERDLDKFISNILGMTIKSKK